MSVYVDDIQKCLRSTKWPYDQACHLVADSVVELQKFATLLGLHYSWFQNEPLQPHYDLTTGMRQRAIKLGAVELNRKKFIKFMRRYRQRKTGGQQSVDAT